MKKRLILVLTVVSLLSFVGCQEVVELSNQDDFVVINVFSAEREPLSENDALIIMNTLENGTWNTEGTSECASNIKITIKEVTYKYHSDCGTFNDNVNQRCLFLDNAAYVGKQCNARAIRLDVYEENIPAILQYEKRGVTYIGLVGIGRGLRIEVV